jgi:hypothetical protein
MVKILPSELAKPHLRLPILLAILHPSKTRVPHLQQPPDILGRSTCNCSHSCHTFIAYNLFCFGSGDDATVTCHLAPHCHTRCSASLAIASSMPEPGTRIPRDLATFGSRQLLRGSATHRQWGRLRSAGRAAGVMTGSPSIPQHVQCNENTDESAGSSACT